MFNIIEVNGGTLRITTAFSFYLKKMNILCAHCGKILPVNNDNKNIEHKKKKHRGCFNSFFKPLLSICSDFMSNVKENVLLQ